MSYYRTAARARREFDGSESEEMFDRISVLHVDDYFQASCADNRSRRRSYAGQVCRSSVTGATEATPLDDGLMLRSLPIFTFEQPGC